MQAVDSEDLVPRMLVSPLTSWELLNEDLFCESFQKQSRAARCTTYPKGPCRYIVYILRAQKGSHIPTPGLRYLLHIYMDPLG